uniref:Uncharacterized protein n=1 Tax=Daucus carota subsp. sativus TaxID=79200 RepID=A0A175YP02_DAUCS
MNMQTKLTGSLNIMPKEYHLPRQIISSRQHVSNKRRVLNHHICRQAYNYY